MTPTATATPRFSIVVPALDEAASIGACLRSLLGQDFTEPYEIIVADNNSRDDTADIARSYGVVVVSVPSPGVCHARQRGAEQARGAVIVSVDADTTYEPGWLTGIARYLDDHPRHVAVAGPCRFVAAPRWAAVYTGLLFGTVHLIHRWTGRTVYATATNLAFRREAFDGYDVTATQGGDELGLLRRLRRHGPVGYAPGCPSRTSSRRLERGFVHVALVTCVWYYLVGYTVNRLTGRRVVGTAPPVRSRPVVTSRLRVRVAGTAVVALAVAGWWWR